MVKVGYFAVILSLYLATVKNGKAEAASFSNFNLDTNWETYLCANENPIVDEKTIIITATGLTNETLPCIALRKNLKISGQYEISSQLINVGRPTGERNFGLVFNAQNENNYEFAYLSFNSNGGCTEVTVGYVEDASLRNSAEKSDCVKIQTNGWNSLRLTVNKKCDDCKNIKAYIDGQFVGSFKGHFITRGFGGVLAENGFNNIAEFRKFDIAPIVPNLSALQQAPNCYQLSSDECCGKKDGRRNSVVYQEPCVIVSNYFSNRCEPLCFATNRCTTRFTGNIDDFCGTNLN